MSKDIADLNPRIKDKAADAFQKLNQSQRLRELGVTAVAISETKRDLAVQMAYYSRSRMRDINDVKKCTRQLDFIYRRTRNVLLQTHGH